MYDQLVTKVNDLEVKIPSTTALINKSQYDTNKQNLKKRIGDFDNTNATGLVNKLDLELGEIENKIPSGTGLVKKTDCDTLIVEIENTKKTDYDVKLRNKNNRVTSNYYNYQSISLWLITLID